MRALLLLIFTFAFNAHAIATDSTPQAEVQAYFSDVQSKGIRAVADHMHPAEIARFKELLLPMCAQGAESKGMAFCKGVFGAGATEKSVAEMSPRDFMSTVLNFLVTVLGDHPALASLRIRSAELVGSVHEGELVHVLARTKASVSNLNVVSMEVISLKKDGDEWRIMLSGNLESLAKALGQQAGR